MHEIETVAHYDQWKLIGQFRLLQEVLDTFGIVTVALTTYAFNFFDLSGLTRCLDVLEVDLWILTEIDYGTEEIEETCKEAEKIK